ncbi:MAG TPA: copper resistance protein CopC, partial [Phototrophicaceae bacterium]|nr:copper resistance protein CopC [Phototrophicaceae bacterium]
MRRTVLVTIGLLIGIFLTLTVSPVFAHASLLRSNPAANSTQETPPSEIILNFSEPVEPKFSRFTLRDSSGTTLTTPASQIDPTDATRVMMQPGDLPNGLYTVVWQAVSAADGHATRGTFAFGIGVTVSAESDSTTPAVDETAPLASAMIRWLNFVSLAFGMGSLGFWLFVWQLSGIAAISVVKRLHQLIWLGWLMIGIAGLFVLWLQTSIATSLSLPEVIASPGNIWNLITGTTYGTLWLIRMGLWLLVGIALYFNRLQHDQAPTWLWLALTLMIGLVLTVSLFSHASGAQDHLAAVAGDWLHLIASTLWTGGLIAFGTTLYLLRRQSEITPPETINHFVDYFSNFARVCVAALIISGTYSAWLQVGTLDALTTTAYGRALLLKLILFLLLLGIAGINLIFTSKGLQAGKSIWVGRLGGLVRTEVVLTISILGLVGVMTAGIPARTVQAIREAETPAAPASTYFGMELVNNQMFHLEIDPGFVGKNQFTLTVVDPDGNPIDDASLIRLRFTNQDQNIGQSEIRPTAQGDGVYSIEGDNLSTPGNYRIRMNMQRPGQFDTIVDFEAKITERPAPPAPVIDVTLPLRNRLLIALSIGM